MSFDRVLRYRKRARNFFDAKRLVVPQRHAVALATRKTPDGLDHRPLGFVAQYVGLHRVHIDIDFATRWQLMTQREQAAAIVVASQVHHDRAQIGGRLRGVAQRRPRTLPPQEGLLHKILGGMAPMWKELKNLTGEASKSVGAALDATKRIDGYMASYEGIRREEPKAIRALGWASTQLFVVSQLVLAVAVGGAFVNFNLIALPMSELVPSGSRIGGLPVASVAALVVVLMEVAAGIFAMEMLSIIPNRIRTNIWR